MRDSNDSGDRGNMERMGESAGAMAGRAADFGMEVTGALFRSAAEMLGGWWSSSEPQQAAVAWNDQAENRCRTHFQANAGGSGAAGTSAGGIQTTHAAPKSQHAAMQSAGEISTDTGGTGTRGAAFDASARVGDTEVRGKAQVGGATREGATAMDSATDGFAHARPGYQLGYVARRNPAYQGRSFGEIEPELQRVWESRTKTEGGSTGSRSSWPEVRGFVDFAYQQGE